VNYFEKNNSTEMFFSKTILLKGKNWPQKKMLDDVSLYSIYTRKLSQRGEYNKFKIHALVWQLGV
jgi:hypothetical protein